MLVVGGVSTVFVFADSAAGGVDDSTCGAVPLIVAEAGDVADMVAGAEDVSSKVFSNAVAAGRSWALPLTPAWSGASSLLVSMRAAASKREAGAALFFGWSLSVTLSSTPTAGAVDDFAEGVAFFLATVFFDTVFFFGLEDAVCVCSSPCPFQPPAPSERS